MRVAKDVGIEKAAVWAGISPQGKKELIQRMQEEGDVVAMVLPRIVEINLRLVMVSTIPLHWLQPLSVSH